MTSCKADQLQHISNGVAPVWCFKPLICYARYCKVMASKSVVLCQAITTANDKGTIGKKLFGIRITLKNWQAHEGWQEPGGRLISY